MPSITPYTCGKSVVVCGIWDPNPDMMNEISVAHQFPSLEALLADKTITAVMICSPDEYHLTQIEMALAAGKHVFCEKPLLVPGQSMEQLEAAFDLAKEKGLVVTSCHPRRYDPPFWWLRNEVSPRRDKPGFQTQFGKVTNFNFSFSYHKPSNAWKHDRSLLLDHLNHEVDLMNYFFGIQGFEAWKLYDSFDHYEVRGVRDDGIQFHFRGTRHLEERIYPEWCSVTFDRGKVELDMMVGRAYVSDYDNRTLETVKGLAIDYDGRLHRVMNDFAGCQIQLGQTGYLSRSEMLMNTECGIVSCGK